MTDSAVCQYYKDREEMTGRRSNWYYEIIKSDITYWFIRNNNDAGLFQSPEQWRGCIWCILPGKSMWWRLCHRLWSGTGHRLHQKSSVLCGRYPLSAESEYVWRRFLKISEYVPFFRQYLCNSGRHRDVPSWAIHQSYRTDHGSTVGRNRYFKYSEPSEPHRHKSSPCLLCSTKRRCHGIRPAPCTGTGFRYLRCPRCCHRRLLRNFQRTCRTDFQHSGQRHI